MRLAAGGFGNTEEDQRALAAWLSSKLTGDPNAFAEDVEGILGGTALEDDQGIQLLAHHNNPNLTPEGNVTTEGLTNAREESGEPFGVGFGGPSGSELKAIQDELDAAEAVDGILNPSIQRIPVVPYEAQLGAQMGAAQGIPPLPEIMLPNVAPGYQYNNY